MRRLLGITWIEWLVIAAIILLSAELFVGLNPDNTLPAALVVPSNVAHAKSFESAAVQLILTNRHPEAVGRRNSVRLDFVLVNRTEQAISYSAYSPQGLWGNIRPLYAKAVKRDGVWSEKHFWCGNGVSKMRVRPGNAGKFSAHVFEDEQAIRIGVRYTWQGHNGQAVSEIVWSAEIPFEMDSADAR